MYARSTTDLPPTLSLVSALEGEKEILARSSPLQLGFPKLQSLTHPAVGLLFVLGGRPGMFKTTWAFNMACNLALVGKRVAWIGLEMRPGQMTMMLIARLSRVPYRRIVDSMIPHGTPLSLPDQKAVDDAVAKIDSLPLTIHNSDRSVRAILKTATAVRYDAVFVDHLGLIGRGQGDQFEVLELALSALRNLSLGKVAQDYHPFVFALSQLNREIERGDASKQGAIRYPRLSDLRGSGNIEADADAVVILHRPNPLPGENPTMSAIVAKNRQGPCPAEIELEPNPPFYEVYERCEAPPPKPYQDVNE